MGKTQGFHGLPGYGKGEIQNPINRKMMVIFRLPSSGKINT